MFFGGGSLFEPLILGGVDGGVGFYSWLGWVVMRGNGGGNRVDEVRGVRVQPRLPTCISCRVLQQ